MFCRFTGGGGGEGRDESKRGVKRKFLARIFKLLRSPGIDSKESIPSAYVAWRAESETLVSLWGEESIPGTESGTK